MTFIRRKLRHAANAPSQVVFYDAVESICVCLLSSGYVHMGYTVSTERLVSSMSMIPNYTCPPQCSVSVTYRGTLKGVANVSRWFLENGLLLNPTKTEAPGLRDVNSN